MLKVVPLVLLLFTFIAYVNAETGNTIGTSTYTNSWSSQRRSFYAYNRYWVFYSDGTNIVYRTSLDGTVWTSATTVRVGSYGFRFSAWLDGTALHYAYGYNSALYYRRGTINSDGSITWIVSEQTIPSVYNMTNMPYISVDSSDYVWIGYRDKNNTDSRQYPYVVKSQFNNGTWGTTPAGFPYLLQEDNLGPADDDWIVSVVPLTNDKMFVMYVEDDVSLQAQTWDGASWRVNASTTTGIYEIFYWSIVAQNDDVHLSFSQRVSRNLIYTKYTYSSNTFSTESVLQSTVTSNSVPILCVDLTTNNLYIFWSNSPTTNHIYYRRYVSSTSTWESRVDWLDESVEGLTDIAYPPTLAGFYRVYEYQIGIIYLTSTSSPYNVKFAYLDLSPISPTTNFTRLGDNFVSMHACKC